MKRKFRKTFKLLAYVLLYLFISIGTAYGVINISIHNASIASIANSKSSEAAVPAQLKSMVTNISNKDNIAINAQLVLLTESETVVIKVENTSVYMKEGIDNLEVQAYINVLLEQSNQEINLYFAYQNNTVYASLFGSNIKFSTENITDALGNIMGLLNVPGLDGLDLTSLDINSILGMLSDLTETKTKEGVTLDIKIPVIEQTATLVCDNDYNLQSVSIPSLSFGNIALEAEAYISYPEEKAEIEVLPSEEYLDLTPLLKVSKNMIAALNKEVLTFGFEFMLNDIDFVGNIALNTQTFDFEMSFDLSAGKFNLIGIDDTLYMELGKYYGKVDLTDREALNKAFECLNLNFDDSNFQFRPLLKEKGLMGIIDILSSFDIDVDLSNINLNFLENIEEIDGNVVITLQGGLKIVINTDNDGFGIKFFDGHEINFLSLSATDGGEIKLRKHISSYLPLEEVLPGLLNGAGVYSLKIGKLTINIQVGNMIVALFMMIITM